MIFVIIGIVILVISFIIALASLTREQKKLDYKTQDSKPAGFKDSKAEEQDSLQDSTLTKTLEADETRASGSFPWEEGYGKDQKNQPNEGEETIEKIQAELAARISANKPDLSVESKQTGSDSIRNNLSGEISIEDLKRR